MANKANEIQNHLRQLDDQPYVICLQETFSRKNKEHHFLDYSLVTQNRDRNLGGGLAIYIHKFVNYKIINVSNEYEYIKIQLEYQDLQVNLVNYYNPPNTNIEKKVLDEFISQPNKNLIIVGDFNCHNTIWGSKKTDKNGKVIENFIIDNNYILLNDSSPTRFDVRYNTYSSIDLSIATPNIARVSNWQACSENFDSDHFLIKIDISLSSSDGGGSNQNANNPTLSYNRADWASYFELTKNAHEENIKHDDVNFYYLNILQFLKHCANLAIPPSKPHSTFNPTPWWNKSCSIAIKRRNTAKRKYRKTADPNDLIEYKKLKAVAQKTIRKAKTTHWNKFCTNINQYTPTSKVWNKIKTMTNPNHNVNSSFSIQNKDGLLTNDSLEKSNIIADYFSGKLYTSSHNVEYPEISKENINNDYLNDPLTFAEVMGAINACTNTAPGPDNIRSILLQKAHPNFIKILLGFFNKIWDEGYLPKSWHHAIMIPVPKAGKDKSTPKGYRPVSLTCTLCKVMERILNNRIVWYLEKCGILCAEQSGFRPGRSVIDSAIKLHNDIIKARIKKQFVCAVFMDIEGAFDTVKHNTLITTLKIAGINGRMLRWICDFLRDRTFHVRMEGAVSETKSTNQGIPQGSVISPTLFNVLMSSIGRECKYGNISIYADDIALWKAGMNAKITQKFIQMDIDKILVWIKEHNMKISNEKTKYVIFKTNRKIEDFSLHLDINYNIERVNTFKFLGIHFDSMLTWRNHIDNIVTRSIKRICLLKAVTGTSWGANCRTLLLFYKQYIRPIIEYGSELYSTAAKKHLRKLDTLQYASLMISVKSIKTTSLQALQVLCNEYPLDIYRKLKDDKYKIRILSYPSSNPAKECLQNCWEYGSKTCLNRHEPFFLRTIDVNDQDVEVKDLCPFPPWKIPNINIDLQLHESFSKKDSEHVLKFNSLQIINTVYQYHLCLYTDGSKDPNTGATGAALYIPYTKTCLFKRICNVSVCRAEQAAIIIALEWLKDYRPLRAVILTDSLSTLLLLKQSYFKATSIIQEILISYRDLVLNGTEVTFCWIPSHCDISGNEIADHLAKKALTRPVIDMFIKQNTQEKINDRISHYNIIWQARWDSAERGRSLYHIMPSVTCKRTNLRLPRRSEVIFNRLRLGKAGTKETLKILKVCNTNLCEVCGQLDSVAHYILECTKYTAERNILKEKLEIDEFTLGNILCKDSNKVHALIDYVKSTNMYHQI